MLGLVSKIAYAQLFLENVNPLSGPSYVYDVLCNLLHSQSYN